MKLAFSQPTASSADDTVLFSRYRDAGYDGLQLKPTQYLRDLDDPGAARAAADRDPGRFAGLIFAGGLDAEGQEALRRVIAFASTVGSELVVFVHAHPRSTVTQDDLRSFAAILSRLGEEAREGNVKLSLHNHYDSPVMYAADLRSFFEYAAPGAVGLTLDTAHLHMAGEDDVAAAILELAGVVDNVHLKDVASTARDTTVDNPFVRLGYGAIDFAPIFSALACIRYASWLCVDEESGAGVEASLRKSREFVVRHLRAAGMEVP